MFRVFLLSLTGFLMTSALPALSAPLIEAESVLTTKRFQGGEGTEDRKLTAFGGACLGNGWGQEKGNWAEYAIEGTGAPATLHLRYARYPISGQRRWSDRFALKARIGEREGTIELPFTGDWELWRWVEVPLGNVSAGPQTLRLESLTENAPINIDALVLAPTGQTPPEVSRPLLFDGSRHLRIQLSPSMEALEMDKLFAIGEASYAFLKEYLGEEPSQRILVNIIGTVEKRDDHVGHSSGYSMYLEGARIWETGHNWVHEMTHTFQRDNGPWTTWLSEGEAWLTSYESQTSTFGDPAGAERISPAAFKARLPQYEKTLLVDGQNLMQFWGTPRLPREKTGAAYGFTNYLMGQLREKSDVGLMRRYRALLRAENAEAKAQFESATPEQRNAFVIDRLGRAANEDLRPLFQQWGFQLPPK
jgi:hypothetical protein